MTLLVAIAVLVAMLIAADETIDVSDGTTATEIAAASGGEPAAASAGTEVTREVVANQFATAWSAGDWTAVAELSNDSVVEVARQWHVEGLEVTVVTASLREQGGEMLVVDPTFTPGLIFGFRFSAEGTGHQIGELFFNGDAG